MWKFLDLLSAHADGIAILVMGSLFSLILLMMAALFIAVIIGGPGAVGGKGG